ncbi:hypothetical protein JHK85_001533 [Glycine max]|nr:hypothetical protein JHK85_001533 [Glycine max]KAG5088879.1 hypothetical protein JHK86_001491 [Glycine max]
MANSSSSLLPLANNNTFNLSLQLPPITIKLDRDNYSLWRSTIISALETFELESFILSPAPPNETRITTTSDGAAQPPECYFQNHVVDINHKLQLLPEHDFELVAHILYVLNLELTEKIHRS